MASFDIGLESRSRDFARTLLPGVSRGVVNNVYNVNNVNKWLCLCNIGSAMSVTIRSCHAKVRMP